MVNVAFSARAAGKARDKAIEQVADGASEKWMVAAYAAVLFVAKRRAKFTTDAVWFVLRERGVEAPSEPRAMGPVMIHAVSEGVCTSLWRYKRSVRVACHRRPVVTYTSHIALPAKKRPKNKRMPL